MSLLKMGEHCLQLCVHVTCRNTVYAARIILIAGDIDEIGFKIWLI